MTSPAVPAASSDGRFEVNLFERFCAQARKTPRARAIAHELGEVSYEDLLNRSNRFREALARLGLDAEQPVGVMMPRTPDLVACLLACLAQGLVYVPLDLENPPERTRRIVEGVRCRAIVGDPSLYGRFLGALDDPQGPLAGLAFVDLSVVSDKGSAGPVLPVAPGGARLAYVLHTSGSTGAPKGVETEHRNVASMVDAAAELLAVTAQDCFLAASPIGFDSAVAEVFLPLLTGASLFLTDRGIWLSPAKLAADIVHHGVTMVATGPSTWAVILSELKAIPRLRVLISHAEALPAELARRLVVHAEQAWNLYGPTETTVWACGQRLPAPDALDALGLDGTAPIGSALANAELQVINEDGRAADAGEIGELWISGDGVARGYRFDPDTTARKFVERGPERTRFYRTGDLVSIATGGAAQYHGRIDDQMKIRGMRVEPGEVESALLSHPQVRQAAVTWFDNGTGSRSIVAAIAGRPAPEAPALVKWLETRLPPQMIPSRFVPLETLPLLTTGKVDRSAIRRAATEAVLPASDQALGSVTALALAGLWQRILRVPDVKADANFLAVGGDSLAAVRLAGAVEATFKVRLPIESIFDSPTLERMAALIDHTRAREAAGAGDGHVVSLVEAPGGLPIFFNAVDHRLGEDGQWTVHAPLYSITPWSRAFGFASGHSVVDLAAGHVAAVREVQPVGPYRLAGVAAGALVALEMAQQLEREGEQVESLFLLNPVVPADSSGKGAAAAGRRMGSPWRALEERFVDTDAWQKLMFRLTLQASRQSWSPLRWLAPSGRWPGFWYPGKRFIRRYLPKPYRGRALAFFETSDDRTLWSAWLGDNAESHVLDGAGQGPFSATALAQWMPALEKHIDELNWGGSVDGDRIDHRSAASQRS